MTLLPLIVIAGSLWWVSTSLETQIASAIRRYGPDITGVSITLSGVTIAPVDGTVTLRMLGSAIQTASKPSTLYP